MPVVTGPRRGAGRRTSLRLHRGRDERAQFGRGELVLVPAMVPHAFRNVGDARARLVGFFASTTVVAIADDVVQPVGGRVIGSPPPELAGAL